MEERMENPMAEDICVSYDEPRSDLEAEWCQTEGFRPAPALAVWVDPIGGPFHYMDAVREGRALGEAFRAAEEEAAFQGFLMQESPCGIHLFPTGRLTCPICARERARIRLGFYDPAPSEDEEA